MGPRDADGPVIRVGVRTEDGIVRSIRVCHAKVRRSADDANDQIATLGTEAPASGHHRGIRRAGRFGASDRRRRRTGESRRATQPELQVADVLTDVLTRLQIRECDCEVAGDAEVEGGLRRDRLATGGASRGIRGARQRQTHRQDE